MKIIVGNLTLRFYKDDGWTKAKVRKYLIDKSLEITERVEKWPNKDVVYYACYEKSGHKVFSKELLKHEFLNPFNCDIGWYY